MSGLRAGRAALISAAAVLSGTAAVSHELLWVRRLGETLGQTAIAVNVVLAVFFAGLGAGAWLAGRWVDRRAGSIVCFVALEGVVAAFGLLFLPLSAVLERALAASASAEWPPALSILAKSLGAAALIGAPALAMGGTIPALARHVVARADQVAPRVGWLYGLNTLGAAAAPALVVFVAIPRLGVPASFALAAAANVAAAALAFFGRARAGDERADDATAELAAPAGAPPPLSPRAALAIAALTGFVSVGLEVLWTRALAARFTSTVYSFATILAVTLLCLGAGAIAVSFLARVLARPAALAALLAASGVAALLSLRLLHELPPLAPPTGFADVAGAELLLALAVMAAPLLLFGMTFPIVVALARRDLARLGTDVGRVYLANTAGSVAAPLAIGFVVLPALGLKTTGAALAWLAIAGAVALFVRGARVRRAPALAACTAAFGLAIAATAFLPVDVRLWRDDPGETLVEYREGVSASVAVVDDANGDRLLKVNHHYRLGGTRGRLAQARQGLIPLLLHPDPRRALVLGLGTGCTAGAAAALGGTSIDVVEILPELADVLPRFDAISFGLRARVERDPTVRLLPVDARAFVASTDRRYDVIVGDLFVPWRAGEGAMYTREHFAAVRARLADGGLFCQWIPLYQLGPRELQIVTATFVDVFPHASAWWLALASDAPVIGLVGSNAPLAADLGALTRRLADPARAALLADTGLADPRPTLGSWIASTAALRRLAGDAPLETRDRPRIEFQAPRAFERGGASPNDALTAMLALADSDAEPGPLASLAPDAGADVAAHRRAIGHLLRASQALSIERSLPRAMDHCIAALEAAPRWSSAIANVAQTTDAALRERQTPLARRGADALNAAPASALLGHYFSARVSFALGQKDAAVSHVRAALELDPSHEPSRQLLQQLESPTR